MTGPWRVDARDAAGLTALMLASARGHLEAARALLAGAYTRSR